MNGAHRAHQLELTAAEHSPELPVSLTAGGAMSAAAQSVLLVLGAELINAVSVEWPSVLDFTPCGAVLTLLKSLIVGASDGTPSTIKVETLANPDGTGKLED